jgi:hypothetical protein
MKKVMRLTEGDLMRLVKRVIKESQSKRKINEEMKGGDQQFAEKILSVLVNQPDKVQKLKYEYHPGLWMGENFHRYIFQIGNVKIEFQYNTTGKESYEIYVVSANNKFGAEPQRLSCDMRVRKMISSQLEKMSAKNSTDKYKDLDIDDEFSE